MNENEWVKYVVDLLNEEPNLFDGNITMSQGTKIPYVFEIQSYSNDGPNQHDLSSYEADILVSKEFGNGIWKHRIVIEAKLANITTHDAITYSEKAIAHKRVHPYLRY